MYIARRMCVINKKWCFYRIGIVNNVHFIYALEGHYTKLFLYLKIKNPKCVPTAKNLIWVIVDYGCLLPFEIRCYYVVRMYIFWDDNAKAHLIFCSLPVWPNCTMHNAVSGTHCRLQINLSNLFDELLKSDRNLTLGRIPVLLPPRHLSLSPIKAPAFYNNDHLSFPLRRCPIWYCWDIYQNVA